MSVLLLLILVVVGLTILAIAAVGVGWIFRANPNRVPCPGCGKMIMTPVERCPKCGRDMH